MEEEIKIHGNPEKNVFGLVGSNNSSDNGKLYIKKYNDSKNLGWREVVPLSTPTPTPTPTFVAVSRPPRTPRPTGTPTKTPTPTITPTIQPPPPPVIRYSVISTTGGSAGRSDGQSPNGIVSPGQSITVFANISSGYSFLGWTASTGASFSSARGLSTTVFGFNSDITITANFKLGILEIYRINATADNSGRIRFNYIDAFGVETQYSTTGLQPGQSVTNVICGNSITSAIYGSAVVTSVLCDAPPEPTPSTTPAPEYFAGQLTVVGFTNCDPVNIVTAGFATVSATTVNITLSWTNSLPIYLEGDWPTPGWLNSGTTANTYVINNLSLSASRFYTFGAFSTSTNGNIITITIATAAGANLFRQASGRGKRRPGNEVAASISNVTGIYKYNVRNTTNSANFISGNLTGNSGAVATNSSIGSNFIALIEFLKPSDNASTILLDPVIDCDPTPTPTPTVPTVTPSLPICLGVTLYYDSTGRVKYTAIDCNGTAVNVDATGLAGRTHLQNFCFRDGTLNIERGTFSSLYTCGSPPPPQCFLFSADYELGNIAIPCCDGDTVATVYGNDIYCLYGSGFKTGWTILTDSSGNPIPCEGCLS
jgi:hypothetical protein